MDGGRDRCTNGRIDGRMKWTDQWTDRLMGEQKRLDGKLDRWTEMNKWTVGYINGCL